MGIFGNPLEKAFQKIPNSYLLHLEMFKDYYSHNISGKEFKEDADETEIQGILGVDRFDYDSSHRFLYTWAVQYSIGDLKTNKRFRNQALELQQELLNPSVSDLGRDMNEICIELFLSNYKITRMQFDESKKFTLKWNEEKQRFTLGGI